MRYQTLFVFLLQLLFEPCWSFHFHAINGSTLIVPCSRSQQDIEQLPITWYHNGRPIVPSLNFKLEKNDSFLFIYNITEANAGEYQCVAREKNRVWANTHTITVGMAPSAFPHSCADFPSAWEPCGDNDSFSGEAILKKSLAEFSTNLYHHLQLPHPSRNLLYSPIIIADMLTHILLGSRGATRSKLEDALRLPRDFSCVHLQMSKMRRALNGSLDMASQIYHNPNLNLTQPFLNQSVEFYSSSPEPLLGEGMANSWADIVKIYNWVSQYTQYSFTQLLDPQDPYKPLVLLNAATFNGQWETMFESANRKSVFTKLNGDTETVPVLYSSQLSAASKYIPELKAQVMLFPLTGNASLYILLPRSHNISDLQQLEERLSDSSLALMMEALRSAPPELFKVTLPKIRLDLQTDMGTVLRKLDLSELFARPNLCGLHAESPVVLDGGLHGGRHQAFLALTEEGVEAGAATAPIDPRSFPSFSATRPFVLLLWSDQADVPLFMGRVTQP